MAADQLPAEVGEFATYLDGLLARLDRSGGWCAVFWQRDPEGMRACLDGREVPPWDVVEALLRDLAGQYGPGGAGPESERARALHAAALAAYDTRPGGRDALGDRLDVMLREQKYAAERQAALARHLTSATTPEQADALRLDLAWARDDHERARARCAELRARMAHLDRREQGVPAVWRDGDGPRGAGAGSAAAAPQSGCTGSASAPADRYGAADPGHGSAGRQRPAAQGVSGEAVAGAEPDRAPAGSSGQSGTADPDAAWAARRPPTRRRAFGEPAAGAAPDAFPAPAGSGAGWPADRQRGSRSGSGEGGGGTTPDGFADPAGGEVVWRAQRDSASRSGSGEAGGGAASEGFADSAGGEVVWRAQRDSASRSGSGEAGGGAASDAFRDSAGSGAGWQVQQDRIGRSGPGEAGAGATPGAFSGPARAGGGQHTPQRPVGRSMPGVVADGTPGAPSAPPPEPPAPKARKRRRGSARFAGMAEEEAAPVVVPPAVVPTLPAPAPVATGRIPRGARFAGAAEEAVVERPAREGGAVGAADLAEVGRTVDLLARLRGEGRSGEAHALLAEVASWEPDRFPLLAERLRIAGLEADWQTLLWEAASQPAGRLVAAADALVAAGRAGDGRQMLRQGVARPPGEVGEAVLGLTAEGRHREVRVLLDAYVRARTPEEAARSAEPDPQCLVPLLLEAAQGVSDERRWDLVHALRVAGFTA
ncbi:hypothetical protein OR263_19455 [Streptomyces sp. NEAU-H22]|uniref:hypothetical protein n=1 Tax=Streptomyces sp. NEAU-H22 TaxID=2994655 RepID=UPI002252F44A|nr:hypothetical protein [Streptomyces sp. NEAU-H22]MCX3288857.1 hypothetical protein [Streptomyces sp. NEAU-H22]